MREDTVAEGGGKLDLSGWLGKEGQDILKNHTFRGRGTNGDAFSSTGNRRKGK